MGAVFQLTWSYFMVCLCFSIWNQNSNSWIGGVVYSFELKACDDQLLLRAIAVTKFDSLGAWKHDFFVWISHHSSWWDDTISKEAAQISRCVLRRSTASLPSSMNCIIGARYTGAIIVWFMLQCTISFWRLCVWRKVGTVLVELKDICCFLKKYIHVWSFQVTSSPVSWG